MVKLDDTMKLELNYMTPPQLIEFAAKFSWLSHHTMTDDSENKFLNNLESLGHNSPKQCSLIVFTGHNIDRAVTHQIVVHSKNIGKSQESQRYVKQSQSTFYKHPNLDHEEKHTFENEDGTKELMSISEYYERGRKLYVKLLKKKNKKEDARRVLPNAIGQSICMWGSVADWQSVCRARMSLEAELPIRTLFAHIYKILREEMPDSFDHEKYSKSFDKAKEAGFLPIEISYKPFEEYKGFKHEKKK